MRRPLGGAARHNTACDRQTAKVSEQVCTGGQLMSLPPGTWGEKGGSHGHNAACVDAGQSSKAVRLGGLASDGGRHHRVDPAGGGQTGASSRVANNAAAWSPSAAAVTSVERPGFTTVSARGRPRQAPTRRRRAASQSPVVFHRPFSLSPVRGSDAWAAPKHPLGPGLRRVLR